MKTLLTLLVGAGLGLAALTGPAAHAAAVKPYPLKTCLVTGNKLGSMGTPISRAHGDQEVKFCCKPCVGKFLKDPARYLAKLK
ncbi:MAG: hypothetical protein JNK37_06955 [Verrucomicrobiales bacterium]|nr:hypothetical protein [Verrucomicrobiales bacterium]